MATELGDAQSAAALNGREWSMVERIVARLREELGAELLAVWLYGSRARGEADPNETDPDLRSDVDLLAIVDSSRDTGEVARWVLPMVEAEADALGECPVYYLAWASRPAREPTRGGVRRAGPRGRGIRNPG